MALAVLVAIIMVATVATTQITTRGVAVAAEEGAMDMVMTATVMVIVSVLTPLN